MSIGKLKVNNTFIHFRNQENGNSVSY